VAIRGNGILPARAIKTAPAPGPDTRTIAIALGGRPEDNAKMVWSRGCMAYLFPSKGKGNAIPRIWFWTDFGSRSRTIAAAKAQHLCCKIRPVLRLVPLSKNKVI
jgi:hypothetical protein